MLHSRDFSMEKSVFPDFSAKNRRFYPFFPDFSSNRFFLCFFFSVPAENLFFGDISAEKNDFLFLGSMAYMQEIRLLNRSFIEIGKASGRSLVFFSMDFLSFSFTFSLAKHPLRMTTLRMSG